MTGVWLEDGELSLRADLPVPVPGPGDALVRVTLAGICGTDLEMLRGYVPFRGVLGHEMVGRIVAGPEAEIGRRVVGEINIGCGRCSECRRGERNHCQERRVMGIRDCNGAFAQFVCLPRKNLHDVPSGVDDDAAVFVEPLAAALRILQQVVVLRGSEVLIVGDGRLGQLVARALLASGLLVTVLGHHASKLRRLESIGATTLLEPPRRGFETAVECSGKPGGFDAARAALRPGGTLVLKSTYAGELCVDASRLVVDEIQVVGSRCGPFAPALELLRSGAIDVEPLITARYDLAQGVAAVRQAASPDALKVVLRMPGSADPGSG